MEGCLDHYPGAYGPTIRLSTNSMETLLKLKRLLRELACGMRGPLTLADFEGLRVTNIDSLAVKTVEKHPIISLRRVDGEEAAFLWMNAPSEWRSIVGLINGLIEGGGRGHQYLSEEGLDDALVELSFREDAE